MKKIELLAPAGDLKKAKIAIMYGADAVFIGGKKFSLRSRASNFDIPDIKEACDFAKAYNACVYVTVNMIPHDEDFVELDEYLIALENAGVKACIVASMFIATRVKTLTSMEAHLSTQMNTTNAKAIETFKAWNIDRVVLARECTIDETIAVSKNSVLPLETFIHGGMCSNYSGRCTLSNLMTLRDANRGGCAQSCRWKYHLLEDDNILSNADELFSMSSTDLCAVRHVEAMIKCNIASLKIEGRMKSEYYIATVVKTYRDLIDEVYATGTLSEDRITYYTNEFKKAENRPTNDGFLSGMPTIKHHLYGVNGAGVTHEFVAYVKSFDEDTMTATIETRNYFEVNDTLEVFGPLNNNQRFVVNKLVNKDSEEVLIANQPMTLLQVVVPFVVYEHDMIRRVKI